MAGVGFAVGEHVLYQSATHQAMLQTSISVVHTDGTVEVQCKPGFRLDPKSGIVRKATELKNVGYAQQYQYYSENKKAWFDCVILGQDRTQIDVEIDGNKRAIPLSEKSKRIRKYNESGKRFVPVEALEALVIAQPAIGKPLSAPSVTYSVNEPVEYYSSTHGMWVESVVEKVSINGYVMVACKPDQWLQAAATCLRKKHTTGGTASPAQFPELGSTAIGPVSPAQCPVPEDAQDMWLNADRIAGEQWKREAENLMNRAKAAIDNAGFLGSWKVRTKEETIEALKTVHDNMAHRLKSQESRQEFAVGDDVIITGLEQGSGRCWYGSGWSGVAKLFDGEESPEYNGQHGKLQRLDAHGQKEAWILKLSGGEDVAIKSENIFKIDTKEYSPSDNVFICGLKSSPQYNGQQGKVQCCDASAGRWTVKLSDGHDLALKSSNMCKVNTKDQEVADVLSKGHLRLVSALWLLQQIKNHGKSWRIKRRQDLPEEAFLPAELAVQCMMLPLCGWIPLILALSYRWLSPSHPDPEGHQLQLLAGFLVEMLKGLYAAGESGRLSNPGDGLLPQIFDVGIFWDFPSLPQEPRNEADKTIFGSGLTIINEVYASRERTLTLQLLIDWDGKHDYCESGWCIFEEACSSMFKAQGLLVAIGHPNAVTETMHDIGAQSQEGYLLTSKKGAENDPLSDALHHSRMDMLNLERPAWVISGFFARDGVEAYTYNGQRDEEFWQWKTDHKLYVSDLPQKFWDDWTRPVSPSGDEISRFEALCCSLSSRRRPPYSPELMKKVLADEKAVKFTNGTADRNMVAGLYENLFVKLAGNVTSFSIPYLSRGRAKKGCGTGAMLWGQPWQYRLEKVHWNSDQIKQLMKFIEHESFNKCSEMSLVGLNLDAEAAEVVGDSLASLTSLKKVLLPRGTELGPPLPPPPWLPQDLEMHTFHVSTWEDAQCVGLIPDPDTARYIGLPSRHGLGPAPEGDVTFFRGSPLLEVGDLEIFESAHVDGVAIQSLQKRLEKSGKLVQIENVFNLSVNEFKQHSTNGFLVTIAD